MRMKLDLNSSPLKLEVGEIYPYKIEIHIAFALLGLLLIASYGFSALLAWVLAMACFEITFLLRFVANRDNSSQKMERICINPFGITSNLYIGNQRIMQNKIYVNLCFFVLSALIILIKLGFTKFLTFNLNQSFFDYYINSLLIISLVNLVPMTNTSGYFAVKKFFSHKNLNESALLNYIPAIILIVLAVELQNIILLISTISIVLYSSAQKFKNNAVESGATITVEEAYTPLDKIHQISSKTLVRDALNNLIRKNSNVTCVFKDEEFKGLLIKDILLDNLSENLNESVESLAFNILEEISLNEKLEKAFKMIDESDLKVIKVTSDDKLVGFVFRDVLYEFMLVNNMLEKLDKADDLFSDDTF